MAPDPNESTSDSDDPSTSRSSSPESDAQAKPTVTESSKENVESESSSSSESGSSTSADSSDDTSSGVEGSDPTRSQQFTKESPNAASRPAKAFNPPSGFKPLKAQSPPSSEISSILSSVHSKQVFHITAPAFLPLSKVNEVSLAKVMQGEPVLTHEGVNYGIPPDSISQGDSNESVLLYEPKSQTYHSSPMCNIQSYHVQEMIHLPKTTNGSSRPTSTSQEPTKPPKKQPRRLKVRFRPVGSGDGPPETIGTSSEESEGETPTFNAPKRSGKEKDERKRKHHHAEGDGNQASGVPRKKSKKHSSPGGANGPSSSQMDAETGHKKSKKSSKNRDEKKRKNAQEAT